MDVEKYSFIGEWNDEYANMFRKFSLHYFPEDCTLEMVDIKHKKVFLRRSKVPGLTLDCIFVGASLNILGRIIKVVDFACEDTKKKMQKTCQRTFAIIKPVLTQTAGAIMSEIYERGFRITKLKKTRLNYEDINYLFREVVRKPFYSQVLQHLEGGDVYGMELVGDDCVQRWRDAMGHWEPDHAAPHTLRKMFGVDNIRNAVHGSATAEDAEQDLNYFFPPSETKLSRLGLSPSFSNCTCCVVKPHAVREGKLGAVLAAISQAGYTVSALNMFNLEHVNAAEFLEIYKGIVSEYKTLEQLPADLVVAGKSDHRFAMVDELANGPCVAMEIVCNKPGVVTVVDFRKFVGPSDPEIARTLRPDSLRARFGSSKVQNGVHCSDLPEDGLLEVEYFFKLLASSTLQ